MLLQALAGLFLIAVSTLAIASPDWMEQTFRDNDNIPINELVLPGTHDSATDEMTKDSPLAQSGSGWLKIAPRGQLVRWGKTQDLGIYEQLTAGIRYLDLRLEKTDAGIFSFHGLQSTPLDRIFNDIETFITQYPKEIVIVHLQDLKGFDNVDPLVEWIKASQLAERVATHEKYKPSSRLGDLWQSDKNLIFLAGQRNVTSIDGSSKNTDYFWPGSISNPWSNTRHTDKVRNDLLEGIKARPKHLFYVSQAVLTVDANVASTGWMRGIRSLRDMALKWMNPKLGPLMNELYQQARSHDRFLNIVIVDFYNHSSVIRKAKELNLKRINQVP